MRPKAGSAGGIQVGVAADDQQAQPAQIVQDCSDRREFAQVELSRPAGEYPGYHGGAFGQHVDEGGIGGQDGCGPGAAGAHVVHVDGCAHAGLPALSGFHALRMPEPAPGIRIVPGSCPGGSAACSPTGHEA